jgi:hypothetical protein
MIFWPHSDWKLDKSNDVLSNYFSKKKRAQLCRPAQEDPHVGPDKMGQASLPSLYFFF